MMMELHRLLKLNCAEIYFCGLGLWDVFREEGDYLGSVIMSVGRAPFIKGNDPDFAFAPEYRFFPHGTVRIDE